MLCDNFEKIDVSHPVHLLLCKNGIERTQIPENFGTGTKMEPKRNQNRNRKNPSSNCSYLPLSGQVEGNGCTRFQLIFLAELMKLILKGHGLMSGFTKGNKVGT